MKLYIIPTPIGNLEDISLRALRLLKEVDFILCEDTRTTKKILAHYGIEKKPCYSYHIHNEHQQLANWVRKISEANAVALTSDAGTPGISDPGFLLIRQCIAEQIPVECLPGATAFVPALVNSGIPISSFYFCGFIPHKKGKETFLKKLASMEETGVFYESPHRLLKTLQMMSSIFENDRQISISRELTKLFEETFRGTIDEAIAHFSRQPVKGEIVVVVSGRENNKSEKEREK
ncbi:MAG TPA: 16S rRNA (cytidine(1402)-2'-O)-methyltransferase [Bacteroidales bacterium]|jgi:16S rRNA (cytidine1402-2'-O)-methyltransferase|nr:16S rRNA (cytidine(1402)-2'-O)-methyltransferase [Bacteroidales bacterium]